MRLQVVSEAANTVMPVATHYAQNGATWILDEIFWVAVVLFIAGAVFAGAKRSIAGVISIVLVGCVVCFFIKNPSVFESIGKVIGGAFGLGGGEGAGAGLVFVRGAGQWIR